MLSFLFIPEQFLNPGSGTFLSLTRPVQPSPGLLLRWEVKLDELDLGRTPECGSSGPGLRITHLELLIFHLLDGTVLWIVPQGGWGAVRGLILLYKTLQQKVFFLWKLPCWSPLEMLKSMLHQHFFSTCKNNNKAFSRPCSWNVVGPRSDFHQLSLVTGSTGWLNVWGVHKPGALDWHCCLEWLKSGLLDWTCKGQKTIAAFWKAGEIWPFRHSVREYPNRQHGYSRYSCFNCPLGGIYRSVKTVEGVDKR